MLLARLPASGGGGGDGGIGFIHIFEESSNKCLLCRVFV
jgi:hypothetical protein